MRCFDMGSCFRVACSEDDIDSFNSKWPCSELRGLKGITFVFEKRNGDLVDVFHNKHENVDGPAVVALCHDAQVYGQRKLEERAKRTSNAIRRSQHELAMAYMDKL